MTGSLAGLTQVQENPRRSGLGARRAMPALLESRMRIGVLECGAPPEALRARFGGYGSMVQRLLGSSRDTTIFDVPGGALSTERPGCDAFVLTGSAAGVSAAYPGSPSLMAFFRRSRGPPSLVGIC